MQAFAEKKIVVVGRSMGVARAIVALAHRDGAEVLAVARGEDALDQLAGEFPSGATMVADATLPETPELILRVMARDVLVLSAGVLTPEYVAGAVVDFVSGRQAGVGVYWAKADRVEALR